MQPSFKVSLILGKSWQDSLLLEEFLQSPNPEGPKDGKEGNKKQSRLIFLGFSLENFESCMMNPMPTKEGPLFLNLGGKEADPQRPVRTIGVLQGGPAERFT